MRRWLLVVGVATSLYVSHAAAETAPSLGTAASFAVLGGSGVVNSGSTRVSANVGVTPGTTLRGFPPGTIVLGDLFVDNGTAREAHRDSAAAFADLAAQSCVPLSCDAPPPGVPCYAPPPGVYCVTSPLPSTLTLTPSGNGPPVWIFRTASLITADDSTVLLRGANYNNVFWQVNGSAILGARSAFAGTIIATGDIALKRDVSMNGRALSLNGAVTLDTDDVSCCDPIEFAPLSLPKEELGEPYNQTILPTGGMPPYTLSLFDGALPPGLTLAPNGTLSGTPTANGGAKFTVLAVDARGCSSIHTYTLCDMIVVSFDASPAKACELFERTIGVAGGTPQNSYDVTGLPDTLKPFGNVIRGTPSVPGTYAVTIIVTDALGCTGSLAFTLRIECNLQLPPLNPSTATACLPYRADLTPTCGTPPFVLTATDLPPGLRPPTNGILAGTPTTPGTFPFAVTVVDANGCTATRSDYTLVVGAGNIQPLPPIPLHNGTVCAPYDSGPLPGVLVDPASLPPGLAFFNASLQGIPAKSGTYCFFRKIPNPPPCTADMQEYCITIECPPLALSALTQLQAGVATSQPLAPPFCILFTCMFIGTLPPGVSLDACVLHGIPQPGDYDFVVTAVADDSGCSAAQHYTGTVSGDGSSCGSGGSLKLIPPSSNLPGGTVGIFYSQMFAATGGTPPYTFTIPLPPAPPPGITLATNGTLSGIPTTPGRFNFAVRVTDATGACHAEVYTIVIGPHLGMVDIPALSPWALVLLATALAAVAVIRRTS